MVLVRCKVCSEALYIGKPKTRLSSDLDLIIKKVNTELSEKDTEKFPRNFFATIVFLIVAQALMIEILFCLTI